MKSFSFRSKTPAHSRANSAGTACCAGRAVSASASSARFTGGDIAARCPYLATRFLPGFVLSCILLCAQILSAAETPTRGMVSSAHPLATEVGLNVLKSGGNAIDAAVAVGFALGVVDTHNSGIGGGCFMLIRLANGEFVAIDGREMAPAAATRDMFIRNGKGDTELSQTGPLASGVPGEIAAFDHAVKNHGRKPWRELILPAADIAEKGFAVSQGFVNRLQSAASDLAKFEASRAIFLPDGKPPTVGDVLKQADLAKTYRNIAEQGSDWFYRGPFAQATEKWMKANGGIMTAADFAKYRAVLREPVRTTYRGREIVSFAPPSSGGVHVVQMLNILENFNVKSFDEVTRWHVIGETMKLAFADRAHWLGDPDYAKVPRNLVSKEYAATLAKRIDLKRATPVKQHGLPPGHESEFFKQHGRSAAESRSSRSEEAQTKIRNPKSEIRNETALLAALEWELNEKHTTHWSVADAEGNWVACTATINTSYGSKVVIPGTGVVLNNEMDDFSVQPGVPNAFGLVGAEANAVAPGKRPLSSMSPTIVLQDGKPIIAIGAAGGPKIISSVLGQLIAMLDLGNTPEEAMALPRIHQQWSPDELLVEKALATEIKTALEQRGHVVKELNSLSVAHTVARSADGKSFIGAADPRAGGKAAGW
jgi:gamma-glutamyltranspeptidase/glutathione hydrolase